MQKGHVHFGPLEFGDVIMLPEATLLGLKEKFQINFLFNEKKNILMAKCKNQIH